MTSKTSTGHAMSDASWLDAHFQSSRAEYEDSLRYVGIQPGWTVLDAGCGAGGFLPLMSELVGPSGSVTALDLAPESVARVDAFVREKRLPENVHPHVGSLLAIPFADATFDCVWSANVMQYLTEAEFETAMSEFKRVLKPGGTLAIKDVDVSIRQFIPLDPLVFARHMACFRESFAAKGLMGTFCSTSFPARFRRAGLTDIRRRGWLIERWAPLSTATRTFNHSILQYHAKCSLDFNLPAADREVWRRIAADPSWLIDDPDFCGREFFVVAVGNIDR